MFARVGEERVDHLVLVAKRQWDRRPDVARSSVAADPVPRQVTGAVLEVGREHLVVGTEAESPGGEIDAGGRVLDEGEVLGGAADVVREGVSRRVEECREAAVEELDRLAFEFALPRLVALEGGLRAGLERAVIEEGDLRVEELLAS